MGGIGMNTRNLTLVALFAVLTAVGARINIPLPVIPFTLQTMFCVLAGLVLGAKLGAQSQALYLFLGLIGIPVFVGGSGPGYILSPSFGYIVGFIFCAWLCGFLAERERRGGRELSKTRAFLISLAGIAVIYVFGVTYLYAAKNIWMEGDGMTLFKVLTVGLFSTAGGDVIKAGICALCAERLYKAVNQTRRSAAAL
jgi:biotin transport system substrate-specific component